MQAGLDRRWWNDKNVKSKVSANIVTKSTLGNFYHRQMINDLGVIVKEVHKISFNPCLWPKIHNRQNHVQNRAICVHEVIVANNGGDNFRRIGELRRQTSLGPLLRYPRSCQNSSPALPLLFCSTLVQSTWACCRSVTILYFGYIWCKDRAHLTIPGNAHVQYWHDWPLFTLH